MSHVEYIDAAIIGLGPAGCEAARVLAQNGFSVFGFDKKKDAGIPVQCAEFVPNLLTNETMAAFFASKQLIFDMLTFVESESPDRREKFSGRMIDRQEFDAMLAKDAITAGAKLFYGTNIQKITENGEIHCDYGQIFKSKIIIGADGPKSIVGKAIGSPINEILETRQITVPLKHAQYSTDIFLSNQYDGGYAWLFPKKLQAHLGIGLIENKRGQLKQLLENLRARLIKENIIGEEILATTGGAIPICGMVRPFGNIGDTQVLLCGDAAGLTNPITGAGIAAAVVSGQLAGEKSSKILSGKNATQINNEYQEELEDLFGSSLERARYHFEKLQEIRRSGKKLSPKDLRSSWVAYSQYWQENNQKVKIHELLEA